MVVPCFLEKIRDPIHYTDRVYYVSEKTTYQTSYSSPDTSIILKEMLYSLSNITTITKGENSKSLSGTTDLGSLIGNTQCGNFRIFLPLKSYVNSILDFWSHWSSKNWRFDQMTESEFKIFGYFWNFQVWNSQKIQIHSLQNGCNDSFWPSKVCKNWFHIKSEWQENG